VNTLNQKMVVRNDWQANVSIYQLILTIMAK